MLSIIGYIGTASQFAKAGQPQSQNLEVSTNVSPSCAVSTERGAAGAELAGGCPAYAKQTLSREFVVTGERSTGQGISEQLVLVINF